MKTKEEILEHLKTAMYNQSARSCIYGWLIGIKICSTENLPHIESLGSKDGAHTFDDFLEWVNQEDKKETEHIRKDSETDDTITIKKITPMNFSELLSRIFSKEEDEAELAYKTNYIVLYNNAEYEIIADEIKEFADALCFFEGEDKVASFPHKTPWIKI